MIVEGEYRIAANREQVWAALNDPHILRDCIPGCESLEQLGDTEFKARIKATIGPVRATFDSMLTLQDLVPPERYRLAGESRAGAAGHARGHADVHLSADGDATRLRYAADFRVGGKLAQVGSRLVSGATRKTADQFFSNFSARLNAASGAGSDRDDTVHEILDTEVSAGRPILALGSVLAAILLLISWYLLR